MRKLVLPSIMLAAAAGCAHFQGPPAPGRLLTIHNEGHSLIDMSYRCTENGPIRRLGAVTPMSSGQFQIRPASCTTVYLVDQRLGIPHPDDRAFAVVPLFGAGAVEVTFDEFGMLRRHEPSGAAR